MSVTVQARMEPLVIETLDSGVAGVTTPTIYHDTYKTVTEMTSTYPATNVVSGLLTLSGGAATLDLTSLTEAGGASFDATGLKLQLLYLEATSTNTGAIAVDVGATNGYDIGGDSAFSISLASGDSAMFVWQETSPDVGASEKDIDFAGTGSETMQYVMVFG